MKKSLLVLSAFCLAAALCGAAACGPLLSPKDPTGDNPVIDNGGGNSNNGNNNNGNNNNGNNNGGNNIGGSVAGKAQELASYKGKVAPLTYAERNSAEFISLKESAESFAATFTGAVSAAYTQGDNFAVSPLSVYMALSLAAECAKDETKAEILAALNTNESGLRRDYSALYRSLEAEYRTSEYDGNKLIGCVDLSNSVWVDSLIPAKQNCLDILASDFYCTSYSADFYLDNQAANAAVREFVKEQTRGLVDQDFALPEE